MAHMNHGVVPGGPYPDKAGEYCGNHLRGSDPFSSFRETPEQARKHQREYLAIMRFGRPRACKAGTTEEMEARGYVGLYLKEDQKLMDWETPCPTPPEMLEPPAKPEQGDRS